ncbi:MAG: uracil-DNA glycosylase [Bacteroidia bacterium]|nr:uracil-DNA glycosylase [Bacteroidia bacterium]
MWGRLEEEIPSCRRCPRLVAYRESVGSSPPPRYRGWTYWSKGVTGFGDRAAWLWLIGLAPAAHGANRTGRMFTGDSSGDWLYRALYLTGFANQPHSSHSGDGLVLQRAFISAAIRCVPPQNKPLPSELAACFPYLSMEWALLSSTVRVIVPLGHVAYKQLRQLFPQRKFPPFRHGEIHWIDHYAIILSYHPSQQNTRTGRLRWEEWLMIFRQARQICEAGTQER